MALATRCPHCHTIFRVAHDQLKLRAGLVRCGACKEIFNGIEHLLPQDALTPGSAAPAPSSSTTHSATPAPSASSAPPSPDPQPAVDFEQPVPAESEPQAIEAHAEEAPLTDTDSEQQAGATAQDTAPAPHPVPETPTDKKEKGDLDEIPDFAEFLQLAEAAADGEPEAAAPEEDAPKDTSTLPPAAAAEHDATKQAEPEHAEPHTTDIDTDPLTRMTLMDFHDRQEMPPEEFAHTQPAGDEVDSIEKTIDELRNRPDRRKTPARRPRNMQAHVQAEQEMEDAIEAAEEAAEISVAEDVEEPSFVRTARHRERFGPLIAWALGIGSLLLTLALLGQGIYTFRNPLAARLPKAKPMLIKACAYLGCRVSLPMQIDAISIEANELQSTGAGKDVFVLTTVLRNRSSLTQAWPNVELTLKDTNGKPLVRRVFLPRDYLLDAQDIERGFAPATEQQLKLVFNLSQPDSSGYEVAIFYP